MLCPARRLPDPPMARALMSGRAGAAVIQRYAGKLIASAAAFAALFSGCYLSHPLDGDPTRRDAGRDTGIDPGEDAGPDGHVDRDGGWDGGRDGGRDGGVIVGP